MGLIRGVAVCQGNAEIVRNLAAEFGIEAICVRGKNNDGEGHIWNQVKLDGVWYDDDFTYYQTSLANGDFDKAKAAFLMGKEKGISITEYNRYKPYGKTNAVGNNLTKTARENLLNYGRNRQQNEQEAETKWMNSFQACDQAVAKMQDGAKKKQEVVQLIQNLEKEHKQEQNKQIQEENEEQVQGR